MRWHAMLLCVFSGKKQDEEESTQFIYSMTLKMITFVKYATVILPLMHFSEDSEPTLRMLSNFSTVLLTAGSIILTIMFW